MSKFYEDFIIITDWQTGYGKLQMMLKTIQTLYRNVTVTLASIKTRLEIVGILLNVDSCKQERNGNFGFYKDSACGSTL